VADVTFKVSMTGLNRLIKKMDDLERGITKVTQKAGKEIADYGVERAKEYFANVVYDGVQDDIEVTAKKTGDKKWNVVATGQAVAFIEYGAGYGRGQYSGVVPARYDGIWQGSPDHPYQGDKAGWVFIEKEGTQYTAGGGPYTKFRKVKNGTIAESTGYGYTPGGNPPNECMLNASKDMARESVNIARTALKKYVFL